MKKAFITIALSIGIFCYSSLHAVSDVAQYAYEKGYNEGYNNQRYSNNPNATPIYKENYNQGYMTAKNDRQSYLDGCNRALTDIQNGKVYSPPADANDFFLQGYNAAYNGFKKGYSQGIVDGQDGKPNRSTQEIPKHNGPPNETDFYWQGYKEGYEEGHQLWQENISHGIQPLESETDIPEIQPTNTISTPAPKRITPIEEIPTIIPN